MARCHHTLVEREESGDCPCCQHEKIVEMLSALKSVRKIVRPFMDFAIGKKSGCGTVSEAEWIAACDAVENAIANGERRL
jgi:hypothetical protein